MIAAPVDSSGAYDDGCLQVECRVDCCIVSFAKFGFLADVLADGLRAASESTTTVASIVCGFGYLRRIENVFMVPSSATDLTIPSLPRFFDICDQ